MRTGIDLLDEFLGGSLQGMILDVYGPGGAGKSQLLMRAAAEAASAGYEVAFVDTTGGFRPERILQMIPEPGILDHIGVIRATSVAEQIAAPAMAGDADMLVLDSITDLFWYEYSGEEKARDRSRRLAAHMRDISNLAVTGRTGVILANTIRNIGGVPIEGMGHITDLHAHIKVRLSGGPRYVAECSKWNQTMQFEYVLDASGLRAGRLGIPG